MVPAVDPVNASLARKPTLPQERMELSSAAVVCRWKTHCRTKNKTRITSPEIFGQRARASVARRIIANTFSQNCVGWWKAH